MEARMLDQNERLSALSPIHREALKRAVDFIAERFQPTGILVAGTIIRGEGHANSDLDFAVIHDKPWRQRVQRFENGIPVEIFVNPLFQWEKTFASEVRSGQPSMLGICSTGIAVYDRGTDLAELVTKAQQRYTDGPRVSTEHLTGLRYALVTQFEDAADIENADLERSNAYVINSLQQAARLFILQSGQWLPREKRLFDRLADLDPRLGSQLRAVFAAPRTAWVELAAPIVERVAGTTRFFGWESEPQPVVPQ